MRISPPTDDTWASYRAASLAGGSAKTAPASSGKLVSQLPTAAPPPDDVRRYDASLLDMFVYLQRSDPSSDPFKAIDGVNDIRSAYKGLAVPQARTPYNYTQLRKLRR